MIKHSLIYTWRMLKKHRFYSLLNLIGLSFSIMSFLVIGLYVKHELSFDKLHTKGERIFRLWEETDGRFFAATPYAWKDQLLEDFSEIEDITRVQTLSAIFQVEDKVFFERHGIVADSNFFDLFDFELRMAHKDEVLRDPNSILIASQLAEKYFGDSDPIGKYIKINLFGQIESFMVQGIVDCTSNSHLQFEYILPFNRVIVNHPNTPAYDNWSVHFLYTYLLFQPEADLTNFREQLHSFLHKHHGEWLSDKYKPGIEPLFDIYLESDKELDTPIRGDSNTLWILRAVAISILLIGLINFINITTARAFSRAKSVSIHKVYGSRRWQQIGQFMVESWLIVLTALILALIQMQLLNEPISSLTGKELSINEWMNISVLSILIAFWLIVGAIAGIYPGWVISAFQPISLLRSRYHKSGGQMMARKVLSIFQIGCATMIIIGTLVMGYQVEYMRNKALGFEKEQLLLIEDGGLVSSHDQELEKFRQLLGRESFFKSASALSSYPGSAGHWGSRYSLNTNEQQSSISITTFYSDFHFSKTMGLEIISGRDFDQGRRTDSVNYIINEACVKLFSEKDSLWLSDPHALDITWGFGKKKGKVIGIVKDFNFQSLKDEISPVVININTERASSIGIKIGTEDYVQALERIEHIWVRLFPDIPFDYQFADEAFHNSFQSEHRLGRIFIVFASIAIIIAMLGLLGLSASMAHEKSKEIGIRKVVGASRRSLIFLLIRQFVIVVIIANAFAIPLGYWASSEWLQNFSFRIDWPLSVILIAFSISLFVTLFTIIFHTFRVSAINPVKVLSHE